MTSVVPRRRNRFVRAVRSQPLVTGIAGAAAAIALIRQLLLPVPEVFGYGEELGEFLYGLGLATIAAWVFNLLVVVLPRLRDQEALYAAINKDLRGVAGAAMAVVRMLASRAGGATLPDRLTKPVSLDDLRRWCEAADPEENRPGDVEVGGLLVMSGTWVEYLRAEQQRVARFHDRLEPAYVYLPVELIALLRAIQDAEYHHVLPFFGEAGSLGQLQGPLYDYLQLCTRLGDYLDQHVAPLIAA